MLCSQLCDVFIFCLDPRAQITNIHILGIIYRYRTTDNNQKISIINLLSPIPVHVVVFVLFSDSSPTGGPSLCTHKDDIERVCASTAVLSWTYLLFSTDLILLVSFCTSNRRARFSSFFSVVIMVKIVNPTCSFFAYAPTSSDLYRY